MLWVILMTQATTSTNTRLVESAQVSPLTCAFNYPPWVDNKRKDIMDSYREHNLKIELEIAREALASYKVLCQNQQAQICRLLDDKHFNRPLIKMSAV